MKIIMEDSERFDWLESILIPISLASFECEWN